MSEETWNHQTQRGILTEPVQADRTRVLPELRTGRSACRHLAGLGCGRLLGCFGEQSVWRAIPWPQVSRLNDEEMKQLMIDVVNRTYRLVHRLFDDREGLVLLLRLAERDPAPHWQTPSLRSR